MIDSLILRKALNIPEIRNRVSRFVTVKDAISCVRVCKTWSNTFVYPIWYSVDFKMHTTFEDLAADVVCKHGHYIRVINNILTLSQLNILLQPSIKNVRNLTIICKTAVRFRILFMDFIRNNSSNLQELDLTMDIPQNSQTLVSGPFLDEFQHTGVVKLVAPIEQIFMSDPNSVASAFRSSLLVHFPNLLHWQVYCLEGVLTVPVDRLKAETNVCCPKLTCIDTRRTSRQILYDFIVSVFQNMELITFAYNEISSDIILALLLHKTTITQVRAYRSSRTLLERDDLYYERDHFQELARALQLIPRSCPKLEVLEFEVHVMDMDHVEESLWICSELKVLRARIKGLDTAEKIGRALQLWVEGRKAEDEKKKSGEDKQC
ncbi:hypothetical protein BGZ80_004527 [Entomortierella chlamydospora]|uniref:F-box domain-containing protein n=1 Tax=Entomortierella chlamydospora TaxID=101097 RepID=A0A9P6T4I0_9FUNG|nr:hypothetical protein BGZ80_004527 [Entomortierella chlamydospora]